MNSSAKYRVIHVGIVLCLLGWSTFERSEVLGEDSWPTYQHGVVAADHPLASAAGVDVLKRGGNAVDAAVATGFALSVLRPASSGLGGGGFMVVWDAKKKRATALDYRERAPLKATRDMFGDAANVSSSRGAAAVAIPGHVAGLCFAQRKYGVLKLAEVLEPAIRYARDGVLLDARELSTRTKLAATFRKDPKLQKQFVGLWEQYLLQGKLDEHTIFFSPQRAALEMIAEHGASAFYSGEISASIVNYLAKHGSRATSLDFRSMDAVERKPIVTQFNGSTIIGMPPPSSGGIAVIETLQIIDQFERANPKLKKFKHNSSDYIHFVSEAMKHAFADRAEFLGDADFSKVPQQRLLSLSHAKTLAGRIDLEKTQPLKTYGRFLAVEDSGTSHFSVMDAAGNAVACTETVNTSFGSWMVDPQFGIVLNNEMDDFAARPGEPNVFGLMQAEANCVGPGKKPLSSMSPTIVVRDGQAIHALGGSGGPRIISNTLQVLLNLTRFQMPLNEAIKHPRFHHQWIPNTLTLESELFTNQAKLLENRGHTVSQRKSLAVIQGTSRTKHGLVGFSDPRKNGKAAGF